jgi:hypothetical protein
VAQGISSASANAALLPCTGCGLLRPRLKAGRLASGLLVTEPAKGLQWKEPGTPGERPRRRTRVVSGPAKNPPRQPRAMAAWSASAGLPVGGKRPAAPNGAAVPPAGTPAGRGPETQVFFPLKKRIFPLENHCIAPGGFSYEKDYGKEICSQTQR